METFGNGAFLDSSIDVLRHLNTRERVVVQSNIEDNSIEKKEEIDFSMGLKIQEVANLIIGVIKKRKKKI